MAVSKRLRYEILRRDNHACRYCGASAPDVPLRIDHVMPVALGGSDAPDNLVTSCEPCNSGKSSASPDAAHVTDVSNTALHWADAMKQAAEELRAQTEPKRAYRDAFQQEWSQWTREVGWKTQHVDLPDGWKGSLDTFYEAALPQEVWPDIIEKAMINHTVTADNIFRYACGIAWRMVRELQDRAKTITGTGPSTPGPTDPVVQAALSVWAHELGDDADDEKRQEIAASIQEARERDVDAHRIVQAAQYAAWFGFTSIDDAVRAVEHDGIIQHWQFAWRTAAGDYPETEQIERVKDQIVRLQAAGVYVTRLEKAAVYAGAHRSTRLHFGLTDEENTVVGGSSTWAQAVELWSRSFYCTAARWPTKEERAALAESFQRIGADGDTWIADIYQAAAAAGAYEDSDISTCLTRHLSVFEAAARPLAPLA